MLRTASGTHELSLLQENWQDLEGERWVNWSMKSQRSAELNAGHRAKSQGAGEIKALTDTNCPLLTQKGFN